MSTNTTTGTAAVANDIAARLAKLVVPDADADARRRRVEEGEAEMRAAVLWGKADVPRRHADRAMRPGKIDPKHPWSITRSKIHGIIGRGATICLTGTRGNGKTQLAVDAILTVTMRGHSALFVTAQRLFMEFKASFDDGARRNEVQVMDGFRRPSLLVIDEIGQRTESDWENRVFFELLNARYNDMTDTILTANLSGQTLSENLGDSIVSRMTEGGGIVECNWESFR